MSVTTEFLAKLQGRIDSGRAGVEDARLLREAVEYIAVQDSALERSMQITEKASALVQVQGKEIERLRSLADSLGEDLQNEIRSRP